jgi:hypothetical protein
MTEYAIQLRTMPGCQIPDEVGLRRVLKTLLRSYGMRAVDVREVPPASPSFPAEKGCELETGKKRTGG